MATALTLTRPGGDDRQQRSHATLAESTKREEFGGSRASVQWHPRLKLLVWLVLGVGAWLPVVFLVALIRAA